MFEEAARARASDAKALEESGRLCGAVYMAGYVVECRLKALLKKQGKSFPTSGREGHNLHALWKCAGFQIKDLSGHKRAFMDLWDTKMRYWADLPPGEDAPGLLSGGRQLAGMISTKIRHARKIKGKRRHD